MCATVLACIAGWFGVLSILSIRIISQNQPVLTEEMAMQKAISENKSDCWCKDVDSWSVHSWIQKHGAATLVHSVEGFFSFALTTHCFVFVFVVCSSSISALKRTQLAIQVS